MSAIKLKSGLIVVTDYDKKTCPFCLEEKFYEDFLYVEHKKDFSEFCVECLNQSEPGKIELEKIRSYKPREPQKPSWHRRFRKKKVVLKLKECPGCGKKRRISSFRNPEAIHCFDCETRIYKEHIKAVKSKLTCKIEYYEDLKFCTYCGEEKLRKEFRNRVKDFKDVCISCTPVKKKYMKYKDMRPFVGNDRHIHKKGYVPLIVLEEEY